LEKVFRPADNELTKEFVCFSEVVLPLTRIH